MTLMYVGFKRLDPSADLGMPFDEAYATALGMHQSEELERRREKHVEAL